MISCDCGELCLIIEQHLCFVGIVAGCLQAFIDCVLLYERSNFHECDASLFWITPKSQRAYLRAMDYPEYPITVYYVRDKIYVKGYIYLRLHEWMNQCPGPFQTK
jgi:hypothetical protein